MASAATNRHAKYRLRCEFCHKNGWTRRVLPTRLSPQAKALFPEPRYKDDPITRIPPLGRWYHIGDQELDVTCYLACKRCDSRINRWGDPTMVIRDMYKFKLQKKRPKRRKP